LVEYHEILDGNRKGDNDDTEMYIQSDGKMIAVSIYFNFLHKSLFVYLQECHSDKVVWKRYFKKQ